MTLTAMLIEILHGFPATVLLTAAAFIGAAILGIPIMLLRLSRFRSLRFLASAMIMAIRGIPAIVWLFIVFFGVGSGFFRISPLVASIVTLGVFYAAHMAEIYRGGIAAIPRGQWEAADALSLGRHQVAVSIVGPQVLRIVLPSMGTYAIALLKDTSLASTIGVTELAYWANHVADKTFHALQVYAMVGIVYILLSLPMASLTRYANHRMSLKVAH